MACNGDPHAWAHDVKDMQLRFLSSSARNLLGNYLNVPTIVTTEKGLPLDWRGLAELAGFSHQQIKNFQQKHDPTSHVLTKLEYNGATIHKLLEHIEHLERWDILADENLQEAILSTRKEEAVNPEWPLQERNILNWGTDYEDSDQEEEEIMEQKDAAFVFAAEDSPCVYKLLNDLEDKVAGKLKWYIMWRDHQVGDYRKKILTKALKRCRMVVFLLTPRFKKDDDCEFCLNFVLALNPGLRKKLLLPVKLQECKVPDILAAMAVIDLTRPSIRAWQIDALIHNLQKKTRKFDANDIKELSDLIGKFLTGVPVRSSETHFSSLSTTESDSSSTIASSVQPSSSENSSQITTYDDLSPQSNDLSPRSNEQTHAKKKIYLPLVCWPIRKKKKKRNEKKV